MSALPKPFIDNYSTPSKRYSSKQTRQKSSRRKVQPSQSRDLNAAESTKATLPQQKAANHSKISLSQTAQFPPVQPLPAKLKVLLLLQKSSLGLSFILIATSIAVYVSTVRIPELWSKKYQDLERLQRQERQLVATNESLKHKLAQQAQQEDSNLTLINSKNTLFIPPASLSQKQSTNRTQKTTSVDPQNIPMGY